jgi:chromosome segregation ATPase
MDMSQPHDLPQRMRRSENDVASIYEIVSGHDRRFDAVDRRFDAVDRRFDAVDRRFDLIETRLSDHDRRFDVIEATLADHGQRLSSLETDMASVKAGVEELLRRLPPPVVPV